MDSRCVAVQFEKDCRVMDVRYGKGEIAGFEQGIADDLVRKGFARFAEEPIPMPPPADPTPAEEEQTGTPRRDKMLRDRKRK